jgi:RNA polymerase sigma factor (sigma-70 family)
MVHDAPVDLVQRANRGEQEAWDALVEQYAGLVWSVIRSTGVYGAEAEDVSQTTWLRCVEHLDRLREPERLGAWLATTARHECYRVLRRAGRARPVAELPEDVDGDVPLDAALLDAERAEELREALTRLPERCQGLLRMLLLDPPPDYDEIGRMLGMPHGSIGPTRQRCLAHLRRYLR